MVTINHGSFVISLDFELLWGMIDKENNTYQKNILGVYEVLPKMIKLFQQYKVNVTVATVGFILFKNKQELLTHLPAQTPSYINTKNSPYENQYIQNIKSDESRLYFAPDLIEFLKTCDNVEIGTHTFCHYYCWEEGQTKEQFEEDIKMAVAIAKEKGIEIRSIVFPRNNVNEAYLPICRKYGIYAYRGNPQKNFQEIALNSIKTRIIRLLDSYFNISGDTTISYDELNAGEMINVPASRLFRPFNPKLRIIDFLKIRRIKQEMKYAAVKGKLYHLWWHPHNFGINIEKNLNALEVILKYYQQLNSKYQMESYKMSQFAELLRESNQ